MNTEAKLYVQGNAWQRRVYKHMSELLVKENVKLGKSRHGNYYSHLLDEDDAQHNFITKEILLATLKRFNSHKAGDRRRVLTNTAASQPYCFNLFVYLNENLDLANKLFSLLLNKKVEILSIHPEFTPQIEESIGDQGKYSGTDADVAIFYRADNVNGLLLVEFKFIEGEFSTCSSYQKKVEVRKICTSPEFYKTLIENKFERTVNHSCGYTRFHNWTLTEKSTVIDIKKVKTLAACPFKNGLNQLCRNMLLAEQVAMVRNCSEFGFWVFSSKHNDKYLWRKKGNQKDTEQHFRDILTTAGNNSFKVLHLETILGQLGLLISSQKDNEWLTKLQHRYLLD